MPYNRFYKGVHINQILLLGISKEDKMINDRYKLYPKESYNWEDRYSLYGIGYTCVVLDDSTPETKGLILEKIINILDWK